MMRVLFQEDAYARGFIHLYTEPPNQTSTQEWPLHAVRFFERVEEEII